jgi:hypothetical protein
MSCVPEDRTLRNGPCEDAKSYKSVLHTEEMKAKLILRIVLPFSSEFRLLVLCLKI